MELKRVPGPGKNKVENLIKQLGNKVGKVGWLDKSSYTNGTSVAYVAAIQEFGYPQDGSRIPPRPFMRPTIAAKQKEWRDLAYSGSKAILLGNETAHSVLDKIGAKAAGDIRVTISKIQSPVLAEATVKARASRKANKTVTAGLRKPLIDTGFMLGTLTHAVEDE